MSKRRAIFGRSVLNKKPKQLVGLNGSRLLPDEVGITDVMSALEYLRKIFPKKELGDRFPPIIFKHQLYALLENRTEVDKDVSNLAANGRIKIFQLEHRNEEFIIILTSDFISYAEKYHKISNNKDAKTAGLSSTQQIISRFLVEVISSVSDLSITERTLTAEFGFKDKDITELLNSGLLTLRDAGNWWFSIPGCGQFVKIFYKGRQAALRMIRVTKYKEISLTELKSRRAPASMKLGILYHAYDLAGSDLVKCISSTTGPLLRLADD